MYLLLKLISCHSSLVLHLTIMCYFISNKAENYKSYTDSGSLGIVNNIVFGVNVFIIPGSQLIIPPAICQ